VSGFARLTTDRQNRLSCDWTPRYATWEQPELGSVGFPVNPEHLEEFGGQHHLAILAALGLTDADDLSLAIDIRHPQMGELGDP
jgi:hypothetical protein